MSGDELAILWADWNSVRRLGFITLGDELAILWADWNVLDQL